MDPRDFLSVRRFTERLCAPLEPEDHVVQTIADVSPPSWHLGHTTWFFETFVLERFVDGYAPYAPGFREIFNSYYNAVGAQHPRARRGWLSRPTARDIRSYRGAVDEQVAALLEDAGPEVAWIVDIGLHHERQHQELLVTDIKHNLGHNPLQPVYRPIEAPVQRAAPRGTRTRHAGGLVDIGHDGEGFAYDNECPRHHVFVAPFSLDDDSVRNAQYAEFIADGGYARHELWLSDGWDAVRSQGWRAPLYWHGEPGAWHVATLHGVEALHPDEPVAHLSYFEAEAFARWAGARLPTEAEWELAAAGCQRDAATGTLLGDERFHPVGAAAAGPGPRHLFGEVWEWTGSPYGPYPGYRAHDGALGEYNGKFMSGQMVLRGGSCATAGEQLRATYRNFFQPDKRWQFSGLRLCRND